MEVATKEGDGYWFGADFSDTRKRGESGSVPCRGGDTS